MNHTPEERRQMLLEEIDALTAILQEQGMELIGSKGQSVAHWALAHRRAAIEALRKLEASSPPAPAVDPLEAWLSAD